MCSERTWSFPGYASAPLGAKEGINSNFIFVSGKYGILDQLGALPRILVEHYGAGARRCWGKVDGEPVRMALPYLLGNPAYKHAIIWSDTVRYGLLDLDSLQPHTYRSLQHRCWEFRNNLVLHVGAGGISNDQWRILVDLMWHLVGIDHKIRIRKGRLGGR